MTVLDRFRKWVWERTITPQQLFSTGQDGWYDLDTGAGIRVSTELAMQAAIGACVRLLADDISTLPIDVFRKVGEDSVPLPLPDWLDRPSGRMWDTSSTFISDFVVSLGTDGNAFLLCTPSVFDIRRIEVLDPSTVELIERDGTLVYKVNGKEHGEGNIVHTPWVRLPGKLRGIDIVTASRESSALELAAREWAGRFFGHGATVGGVLQFPGAKPTKEEADELRKQFAMRHQGRRKSHAFGILFGGATYNPMTIKPQEAELGPLWRHVLEEACRIYHIPPHLLSSQDPGGSSFSSVEQRSIEYVMHGVRGFVVRIERTLSRLIEGEDTFVRINVNGLMRGDFKTRVEAYGVLLDKKVVKRSEVRALEDLRPIPEADDWLETPNNNPKAEAAPDMPDDMGRSMTVNVNDAPVTVSPELRIDSVIVSDQAVERIADASTTGIAAGIAVLGSEMASGADRLADTFTASLTRVEQTARSLAAEVAAVKERQAAAEERERLRSQPVNFDIRRDEHGRTSEVFVRQGEKVTRKRIRHDESGRVIGVMEEAVA